VASEVAHQARASRWPLSWSLVLATLTLILFAFSGCESVREALESRTRDTFRNPLADSGPDPWMTYYDGNYYLATATWGSPSVGLTMRKAPTIRELITTEAVRIWQDDTLDRSSNYWAPEFFLLDGPNGLRWYGYFTGGAPGTDYVHTQFVDVIESEGLDPMGPYTYKGRLVERNALDASLLELNGKLYAIYGVWNVRQDIAIREMSSPWETTGPEVVISRPTYDWERQRGNVNEGPAALYHEEQNPDHLLRKRLLGTRLQARYVDLQR
jgi:GH43 family beta-xylosidase